jgi:MOSC domain-containing protein YiiM
MKLVSLNVGLPHQVKFRGKLVTTAIFKMVAVQHRVKLKRLNFEGDRQADLKVHGGEVAAGDKIELIKMDEHNLTVNDIFSLYTIDKDDAQVMER